MIALMTNTKKYMREYMRGYAMNRYYARKEELVCRLGGKCVKCGKTNDLQFDHIDPSSKSFTITSEVWWRKDLDSEIAKCQLLCRSCHELKSILERGNKVAVGTHGTLSSYRYCRCDVCKKAKSDHSRAYRTRIKQATLAER